MNIVKESIGIDVSKDHLDCSIGTKDILNNVEILARIQVKNNLKGFQKLQRWVKDHTNSTSIIYVMEATGVYYENVAFWLNEHDQVLSVLLPNVVKYYAKSLNVKTKTDDKDAEVLSRIGLERALKPWKIPTQHLRELKLLCREYLELKDKLTASKNQLHARKHSHECPNSIIKRLQRQIDFLEVQVAEVEAELRVTAMKDSRFYEKLKSTCTIPGVGFITALCVIVESNGFALNTNAKQIVSYAGFDVSHNQSGKKQGKSKISKKGNRFIRKALYMPAMSAKLHNPEMKTFFDRLSEKKPAKKIAVTAVARKLLILIYILWKKEAEYDSEYKHQAA